MKPSISEAEFDVLCKRLPLSLTPAQKTELYEAYGHLEVIRQRVRKPRSHTAEPAHIFTIADKEPPHVG